MKKLPTFIKQIINNASEFNAKPLRVVRNFERVSRFTTGQIISSGSWKYAFYDLDNHPDRDTILTVEPTFYRGDFTTTNNAWFPLRTHIISCSDNQTVNATVVDNNIPRHAYPLENDSSIICVNQTADITEEETLTLVNVVCVKPGDDLVKHFDADSHLIPLEGEIVLNGFRRSQKQLTIVSSAKDIRIEGISDVLLAVFK